MTPKAMGLTIFNGFIGMGVGMTLILLALKHGNIGIVSVLSAVTPILVLPLLWVYMKQRPTLGAWIGASFTVIGTAIILLRPH
jgi:drug/metabolite transporter (DMT)-like permease